MEINRATKKTPKATKKTPEDKKPKSKPAPDPNALKTAEEIARPRRVSGRCILNWYYSGRIPAALHVGRVIRFDEREVMAALRSKSPNPQS